MLDAAVITTSVGLSVVLVLIALLGVVILLRVRRVRGLRKNRDQRISLALREGGCGNGASLETTGSRFNEAEEYPTSHSQYDVENGNAEPQRKDRWGSLRNNIFLPRQPPLKNLPKAIISGCLSPLSAIIERFRTWREATVASAVAELPSETSPRNTFENQENAISMTSYGRDSSATYPRSPNTKTPSISPITNPPMLDSGGRESPVPGPPPSRPPPSLPSTGVPNRCEPPGRRSTSRGSALSSKTTDTSILNVCTNPSPRCNVDLHGLPSSSTFHSFKLQGRFGGNLAEANRQRPHQRAKFGRYASWTSPNFRYSSWEHCTSPKNAASRASLGQPRGRASYAPMPSNRPADKIASLDPSMIPEIVEKRNKESSGTDITTRCETCRAITPEHWARGEDNPESELDENLALPRTPPFLPGQENAKTKPKKLKKKVSNQNSKASPGFPVIAPTVRPSRIPSPTRPSKQVQERWPILPAARDLCKTSIQPPGKVGETEMPSADLITSSKPSSTPNISSAMKRTEANNPRSQLPENSKATQTAISPLFSELASLFPHQRSGISDHPKNALQEPFYSPQEKSASYPPSIYWPPIRPVAPSRSVVDLRQSILKLRRMNSEARGRSRSLYLYLQCDSELHLGNSNATQLSGNHHENTNDTPPTRGPESRNDKSISAPRKSTSSVRSTKTAEGSTWEDASLPNSLGASSSFLSGRVSLEWPPPPVNERNLSHRPVHASGTTLHRNTGSRANDDLGNVNFVTQGSLYDSNGFLKE